jgi:dUTP pyrophosphatase
MDIVKVLLKRTQNSSDLPLPNYMSPQAAGMDLYANIEGSIIIESGKYKSIPTGIAIALPKGYEAQVRPRSGLAFKHGITILNSPGTIDADYRGEISVLLINLGEGVFEVRRGDRIAQLVINKLENVNLIEVTYLPDSSRGSNGFGSTGK